MRKFLPGLVFLLLCLVGCERSADQGDPSTSTLTTVGFYVEGGAPVTRTAIGDDGLSMKWIPGDQLSVWASDGSTYVLNNQLFELHYGLVDPSQAYFTATIPAMADGSYIYYALYPRADVVNGAVASYQVPVYQTSSSAWNYDLLVSNTAVSGKLTPLAENTLVMTMTHKMHALRYYYYAEDNTLGEPITRIETVFPCGVVGTVAVNFEDPSLPVALSNSQNKVSTAIPAGLSASVDGQKQYAYALIAPCALTATDEVTVKAYSANKMASFTRPGKDFAAGHLTPVRLRLGVAKDLTILRFAITQNNLGENPQKVTFATSDGSSLQGGSSSVTVDATSTFYGSSGYYDLDVTDLNLSGKSLVVTYESESAIVSQQLTLPTLPAEQRTTVNLTVPYLMYEDFSSMTPSFSHNDTFKTSDSSDPAAQDLSAYGLSSGWAGARVGGEAGKCVRVMGRFETGAWVPAYYEGRMDSAPLRGLKAGKSVKVNVSFSVGGAVQVGTGSSSATTTCTVGWTTSTSNASGAPDLDNTITKYTLSNNGSYNATPDTKSFDIDGGSSATRISWRVSTDRGGAFAGNGCYWAYIDNVRVTIIK